MRISRFSTIALSLLVAGMAIADDKQVRKVRSARWVSEMILQNPERSIPQELLEDTRCLAIFPALKEAAFGLGGRRGTGVVSCRSDEGKWSPPSFVKITEGSIGLQIGYRATDLMLFVVSEQGKQSMVRSKTSLGGDATVAAGPLDHSAGVSTAQELTSDIYIYSQSQGLFAGVSVEGSNLSVNRKSIRRYYDHALDARDILFQHRIRGDLPPEAEAFMESLAGIPFRSQ